jgi:hypothetical protein
MRGGDGGVRTGTKSVGLEKRLDVRMMTMTFENWKMVLDVDNIMLSMTRMNIN